MFARRLFIRTAASCFALLIIPTQLMLWQEASYYNCKNTLNIVDHKLSNVQAGHVRFCSCVEEELGEPWIFQGM